MSRSSYLVQVFNVQCVMCGRASGQLVNGVFLQNPKTRAPAAGKGQAQRCGECGGNLYLEPDESITPFMAAQLMQRRIALAAELRAA